VPWSKEVLFTHAAPKAAGLCPHWGKEKAEGLADVGAGSDKGHPCKA